MFKKCVTCNGEDRCRLVDDKNYIKNEEFGC